MKLKVYYIAYESVTIEIPEGRSKDLNKWSKKELEHSLNDAKIIVKTSTADWELDDSNYVAAYELVSDD
jgi:hypothetical protein